MWFLRGLFFLVVFTPFIISGIGAGMIAAILLSPDGASGSGADLTGSIITATVPLAFGLIFLLVILMSTPSVSAADLRKIRAEGRTGTARVISVEPTGILINDVRVYRIQAVAVFRDRHPYRVELRKTIDPIDAHSFQPGTTHAIVRIKPDRPEIAFDPEGTLQAITESTVASARDWDDASFGSALSSESERKKPRKKGRIRPVALVTLITLWAAAAGVTYYLINSHDIYPFRNSPETSSADGSGSVQPKPAHYDSAAKIGAAVAAATDEYGSDVHEIVVFHNRIILTVRSPENPDHWDDVTVAGQDNTVTHDGAALIQPDPDEYFDASEIDWDLIFPAMANEAHANLPAGSLGDITQIIRVEALSDHVLRQHYWDEDVPTPDYLERYEDDSFEFFFDMTKDEARPLMDELLSKAPAAQVRVSLSHDYGSIYLDGDTDGEILEIRNS